MNPLFEEQFDEAIRQKLKNLEAVPPTQTLPSLMSKLWRMRMNGYMINASLLAFLMFFAINTIKLSVVKPRESKEAADATLLRYELGDDFVTQESVILDKDAQGAWIPPAIAQKGSLNGKGDAKIRRQAIPAKPTNPASTASNPALIASSENSMARTATQQLNVSSLSYPSVLPKAVWPSISRQNESVSKPKHRLSPYIGLMGSLKNTWIYNQNTYGQFGKYELAYRFDWGTSYGVQLGIPVNNRVILQVGYNFKAMHGQRYRDRIARKIVDREVTLVYTQLPVIFRIAIARSLSSSPIYVETGFQYSQLRQAKVTVNQGSFEATDRFKKSEYAFILGLSSDWKISRRLFISTGFHSKVGSNINAREWKVNDDYGKSHNLSFGLTMAINYSLRK